MSITRWLHTATRLADGKVLITGGIGPSFVTSLTAELYDPDAGTFSAVGPMGAARYNHTATLLTNGKVLITGGVGAGGTALATAELYDPDTQTFSATGALVVARQQQTATILANGNVLIVGGLNAAGAAVSSAELYNAATGEFSSVGAMAAARYEHTATLLSNGKVLVAGGRNTGNFVNTAELSRSHRGDVRRRGGYAGDGQKGPLGDAARRRQCPDRGRINAANAGLATAELLAPRSKASGNRDQPCSRRGRGNPPSPFSPTFFPCRVRSRETWPRPIGPLS